jgi:sulfite dehydrogenase (quinone) subunit SoeC
MNPALSVVFLTTLTGMGQGLFVMTFLGHLVGAQPRYLLLGSSFSLLLATLGLVASFFHLGRPERAWRAVAQWRTSWLSREVMVLPAFIGLVALYWLALRNGWPGAALALALLAFIACGVLWVCTAMIYMCLTFIEEWASPLTLAGFVGLGLAAGATIALNVALFSDWGLVHLLAYLSLLLTLAAGAIRIAALVRNAQLKPKSTLQTAIGINDPKITQRSMGATGGTFNTREFFHQRSLAFLRSVKWLFILLTFVVPAALVFSALAGAPSFMVVLALSSQSLGMLLDRWFFFAQARHPQNLYYQVVS